ncbi:hypothetical protein EYS14_23775 [Alteromonadaceae bacterium M269]|nr:hypothetical protein EYS14_23775 [Alteromonadaceae bacterium M269]
MEHESQEQQNRNTDTEETLKSKVANIPFILLSIFAIAIIHLATDTSFSMPKSMNEYLSWIGIAVFVGMMINHIKKLSEDEGKAFVKLVILYLKSCNSALPTIKISNSAYFILFLGQISWALIIAFKAALAPRELFVIGLAFFLWGFSLVLEENGLYSWWTKKLSNRWLLSAIIASILFWAAFSSASAINSVFGVDASHLSFTYTAMLVYKIVMMFSLATGAILALSSLYFVYRFTLLIRGKENSDGGLHIFIPAFSFAVFLFGTILAEQEFQSWFIKQAALKTDFNHHHLCLNRELRGVPVVFLDPKSELVLAYDTSRGVESFVTNCILSSAGK